MMMRSETVNGVCVAHVDGDLTIYTAQDCRALLLEHLQQLQSCAALDIDLSGVGEIDSAGLQLLILARRHGAALGKPVRLRNCSAPVLQLRDLFCLGASWDGSDGAQASGATR
jgi:anti-sigma B factor antagonist